MVLLRLVEAARRKGVVMLVGVESTEVHRKVSSFHEDGLANGLVPSTSETREQGHDRESKFP